MAHFRSKKNRNRNELGKSLRSFEKLENRQVMTGFGHEVSYSIEDYDVTQCWAEVEVKVTVHGTESDERIEFFGLGAALEGVQAEANGEGFHGKFYSVRILDENGVESYFKQASAFRIMDGVEVAEDFLTCYDPAIDINVVPEVFGHGGADEIEVRDSHFPGPLTFPAHNTYHNLSLRVRDTKVYGGEGSDTLISDESPSWLYGEGGNDTLIGGAGPDILIGGEGDDTLYGHTGTSNFSQGVDVDWLFGNDGDDDLFGGGGDDALDGGAGDDELHGGYGDDVLRGGGNEDELYGGWGDDTLRGGSHDDYLQGDSGEDRIYGDSGADTLRGGNHDDVLYGGSNDDKMFGGYGKDILWGGSGNDDMYGHTESNINGGIGGYLQNGDIDWLWGESGNDYLHGGNGDDFLIGGQHNDRLFGGDGNDSLFGQAGNDRLWGETMHGGSGADVFEGSTRLAAYFRAEDYDRSEGDTLAVGRVLSFGAPVFQIGG